MAEHLKKLLCDIPSGEVISVERFFSLGFTYERLSSYVKQGYLRRLGKGVYAKVDRPPSWESAVSLLSKKFSFYIGGDTAEILYAGENPKIIILFSAKKINFPSYIRAGIIIESFESRKVRDLMPRVIQLERKGFFLPVADNDSL